MRRNFLRFTAKPLCTNILKYWSEIKDIMWGVPPPFMRTLYNIKFEGDWLFLYTAKKYDKVLKCNDWLNFGRSVRAVMICINIFFCTIIFFGFINNEMMYVAGDKFITAYLYSKERFFK